MRRLLHALAGIAAALVLAASVLWIGGRAGWLGGRRAPDLRHVPEDASGPLRTIAIHYAPSFDAVALGVWLKLLAALPPSVEIEVAVARAADFERLLGALRAGGTPHLERLRAVVVGQEITTWSRDRFAAMERPGGDGGGVLAPPRIETSFAGRAGDWAAPFALAEAVWQHRPVVAAFVFEGGDLASSPRWLFADANLAGRNAGRADASREGLTRELGRHFKQEIVWLGDQVGEVPQHHLMMYLVPLDDVTVAVGEVRAGQALLAGEPEAASLEVDPDLDGHARRFDRAAELAAARGFRVVRLPVVVLAGAGSYVTYTNALFDRAEGGARVVYLPTYALPALDRAARSIYEGLGYEVKPIDVSAIYQLNGSLGCLVNVMRRGGP